MSQTQHSRQSIGDWIHVREHGDRMDREVWYSPTKDISAARSKDWIEYHDHSSGIYYSFDANERTLYRVPEYEPLRSTHYLAMMESIQQVLQENELPADPLKCLDPAGYKREAMEFVTHSLDQSREDGGESLDYHLTVRRPGTPDLAEWLFRADADTKVLRLARATGTSDGKEFAYEMHFDYSASGPADIYQLGVPRSAKLIDRVLPKEIQQIVDTLRIGRQRMDDYRAIVVPRMVGSDSIWWLGHENMIMYRKGDNFRVDTAHWFGGLTDYAMVEKPPDDIDMEAWWRERVKAYEIVPPEE